MASSLTTLSSLKSTAKRAPNQAIVTAIHDVATQLEMINKNLKKLESEVRQIRCYGLGR